MEGDGRRKSGATESGNWDGVREATYQVLLPKKPKHTQLNQQKNKQKEVSKSSGHLQYFCSTSK